MLGSMSSAKKKSTGEDDVLTSRERTGTRAKLAMPRVLVVDDVPDNRDIYAEYLRFKGYEVLTAEDGQLALEAATSHPLDVIVMDLALPVLDGWEATRRLKADARTRDIPVIALTAHDEPAYRQRALDVGCDVCLTKPHLPEDLDATILRVLAARREA
jgi:two-component system cell cycle response regulator DivK